MDFTSPVFKKRFEVPLEANRTHATGLSATNLDFPKQEVNQNNAQKPEDLFPFS